ncbi:TRAP transporter substrate-binding protein DctP [Neptunomonas antarctica]|uniref:TRAP-type C4-dicarboxylate transport system, substrate-binding protein n=1 Tax=Neptunomonas antarctica TaxID=619304 RepID=A0A1N7N957_9GAMM|nr:TRAP transporter substrate-binding protein DctP [Neptunomonas antarctica]SIS94894.1 TRAP-type C4-dicarboxylate transport system, substrate-binding protein [Neptunomonas antarctica]
MIRKILNATKTISLVAVTLSSVQAGAANWKYAIEENLNEVQGVYATQFKEYIEANSAHSVQIYPFGTLGESDDIMEQAQAGILQFVDQSPGFTGSLIPEAQVFLMPYVLPESVSEVNYFFKNAKVISENFKVLYAEQDLELLQMFPEGSVAITTQESFHSPADLDGMKIRVMTSPLLVETYKAFGAVPTPLPWGEVFGALQTNLIQGQENPWFYIESGKLYEVSEVITEAGHNIFTTAVMANKNFYEGLSETDQQLVQQGSEVALDYILKYQEGLAEESKAKIKAAKPSIEFVTLTEAERAPFRLAAKDVRAKFIEMTGESGQTILDQLEADLESARTN